MAQIFSPVVGTAGVGGTLSGVVQANPVEAAWQLGQQGLATGIDSLRPTVLSLVSHTLLEPFQLPVAVGAPWAALRDIGFALLTVVLLYAVVRWQLGMWIAAQPSSPAAMIPRVGVAAMGVALSLDLARGLLSLNNVLVAALLHLAAQDASTSLLDPVSLAVLAGVPLALGIGPEVLALIGLGAVFVLVITYALRSAEIAVLTLVLPVAAALWVIPAASGFWKAAFGELLVSVFMQSMQVAMLLAYVVAVQPGSGTSAAFQWIGGFGAIALLFAARRLLRTLIRNAGEWGEDAAGSAWAHAVGGMARGYF